MRRTPACSAVLFSLFVSATAFAQDPDELDLDDLDDDIVFDDEILGEEPPPEIAPELEDDGDDDDTTLDDFIDPDDDDIDLLGEDATDPMLGGDTEALYRETVAKLSRREPDEEMVGWESYLATYPQSVFRPRIETRIEELMDELYATGITRGDPTGSGDAMSQEIDFAQPIHLENINPRTRVQAGFEWGLPAYINLFVDYEHQFARTLSLHAGVRRRYSGWNIELGPRWALVKSTRTQTLVTLIGDFHLNTLPSFPAFRPQLAVGTRIGKTDVQLQGGPDIEFRTFTNPLTLEGEPSIQTRIVGGFNLYYAASERVGIFAETVVHMKPASPDGAFDGGLFRFNTATVGMKFFPVNKSKPDEKNLEANVGASVPYTQQYWQYHFGSITGQFNYYL